MIYNGVKCAQPAHACEYGNRVVFNDHLLTTATVMIATGDKLNLCKVPNGTLVDEVVVSNPDLDTGANLVFGLGFAPTDGTAAPASMVTPAVAVAADGTSTWQAAAVTTYHLFPPYRLDTECYLQAVVGTGAGAVQGGVQTIHAKVKGESLGQR
jgi:hypothetical protein